MSQQQVMGDLPGQARVLQPGSHPPLLVSCEGAHPWLIEGHPIANPVTQSARHHIRVVGKSRGSFTTGPPSYLVLQGLWQVPVIQGYKRLDPCGKQCVYQAVVEVKALRIHLSSASGQDTRPCN